MKSSTRLALLLGLQLAAGAAFIACGGDSGDSDAKPDDSDGTETSAGGSATASAGSGTLQLTFSPMYSAFVEGHDSQLPVQLKDPSLRGKGATFTSSDTSIAVVSDTAEGGLITVKKDGVVTIKASFEGETGNAKLTIKKYTEAQWMTGRDRYSKSELAIVPAAGGTVNLLALGMGGMRNPNGACNTCHTSQAKTLKIENTPAQIAGYSDDELITIFTMGKKPANVTQQSMIPAFAWGMFHAWTVTEEEKQGLIAFLRTQAPKANPAMIDYGVKNCDGTPLMAPGAGGLAGGFPMLCDSDGKPLSFPGLPGGGLRGDAGTSTTSPATGVDAGSSMATPDAGVRAAAGDAG